MPLNVIGPRRPMARIGSTPSTPSPSTPCESFPSSFFFCLFHSPYSPDMARLLLQGRMDVCVCGMRRPRSGSRTTPLPKRPFPPLISRRRVTCSPSRPPMASRGEGPRMQARPQPTRRRSSSRTSPPTASRRQRPNIPPAHSLPGINRSRSEVLCQVVDPLVHASASLFRVHLPTTTQTHRSKAT